MTKPTHAEFRSTDERADDNKLGALLAQYPQLNVPQVSRRALLAMGSLMALNLTACGSSDDTGGSTSSSSGSGSSRGGVTTFAGMSTTGSANGTGTAASFNYPGGVAVDSSGNVYVADSSNHMIRMITSAGVVTTLAGSGSQGSANGTGTTASFHNPYGVAVDSSGNVYVADASNHMIRMIAVSTQAVTTLAGSGTQGSINSTTGTAAKFYYPSGVAVDSSGNVYVADTSNNMIRQVIASTGVVTTLAGHTQLGTANGTGTAASFSSPHGVAVDSSGNVYVADSGNNMIRQIVVSTQAVTTLAGSGMQGSINSTTGTAASFNTPFGVAVDNSGNVYVADANNYLIRQIVVSTGLVTTLAGGAPSPVDGTGTAAGFAAPQAVAVSSSGILYVADGTKIRKIS